MNRRHFLGVSSGASLGLLAGCAANPINISKANVVVVGGGYGLSLIHISEPTRPY